MSSYKGKGVDEIFDDIWSEEQISKMSYQIGNGLAISIGIIWAIATATFARIGGIAAGLGFDLLDKHFRPRHRNRPARNYFQTI